MRRPLVSVIIPCWNRAGFVSRAMDSVKSQDCVDLSGVEVLVVDDGSTDGCRDEIQLYDAKPCRKKALLLAHCGKPGLVRNHGIQASRGEFVAFLDSDDIWFPHHLATALLAFGRDPGLGMVSNDWSFCEQWLEGGRPQMRVVPRTHAVGPLNTNCHLIRDEIAKGILFNEKRWGEDQDYFNTAMKSCKHLRTGVPTTCNGYVRGGNNLSFDADQKVKEKWY